MAQIEDSAFNKSQENAMKKRVTKMGRFKRLQAHRVSLGWDVADLVRHLPDSKPSDSSIYRLEGGGAIRLVGCYRIFEAINKEHGVRGLAPLIRDNEVEAVTDTE